MKLIILLLSLLTGFGATVKKSSDDLKELRERTELNQYSNYPNLLPVVEVVAPRIPNDSIE